MHEPNLCGQVNVKQYNNMPFTSADMRSTSVCIGKVSRKKHVIVNVAETAAPSAAATTTTVKTKKK